jgi:aldehyde dehydrogenase (NAD+)
MSVAMSMIGAGQGCALPTRLFVARKIYDEALQRIQTVAEHLPLGSPFAAETMIGPVMTAGAMQRILGEIERAKIAGEGRLIAGGQRAANPGNGYFIQPTVFADVSNDCQLAREEIFGPVLSVIPFDDEDAVVHMANNSAFGLAGYIQTRDVERAIRVADKLDAGYISVNGFGGLNPNLPFGGFKQSGYGKEGGKEGIDEFLRRKSVFIKIANQ